MDDTQSIINAYKSGELNFISYPISIFSITHPLLLYYSNITIIYLPISKPNSVLQRKYYMVNLFNFENTITINFGRYYMKILFNSIHLFLFSLYVDFYKYRFDCAVKKRLKNGKNISTKKLTQMSDKCYYLFNSFIEKEKRLRLKMTKA